MDDLNNLSEDVETAQKTNSKTEEMLESKLLSLNLQKSSFIVLGDSKSVERIKEEVRKKPRMLSGKKMEEVKTVKY